MIFVFDVWVIRQNFKQKKEIEFTVYDIAMINALDQFLSNTFYPGYCISARAEIGIYLSEIGRNWKDK